MASEGPGLGSQSCPGPWVPGGSLRFGSSPCTGPLRGCGWGLLSLRRSVSPGQAARAASAWSAQVSKARQLEAAPRWRPEAASHIQDMILPVKRVRKTHVFSLLLYESHWHGSKRALLRSHKSAPKREPAWPDGSAGGAPSAHLKVGGLVPGRAHTGDNKIYILQ